MPSGAGLSSLKGKLFETMTYSFFSKINPVRPYWKKVDSITAAATLNRRVTKSAGTFNVTLPSSKAQRKEFIVISTSGTATAVAVSPDTLIGGGAVTTTTPGTFRAIDGVWYRVS